MLRCRVLIIGCTSTPNQTSHSANDCRQCGTPQELRHSDRTHGVVCRHASMRARGSTPTKNARANRERGSVRHFARR